MSSGCSREQSLLNLPDATHKMTGTPEYTAWRNIKLRCRMKTDPRYQNYGAKGIDVCQDWFEATNLTVNCIVGRRSRGWNDKKILTTPMKITRRNK